jgi:hypothetical protein
MCLVSIITEIRKLEDERSPYSIVPEKLTVAQIVKAK